MVSMPPTPKAMPVAIVKKEVVFRPPTEVEEEIRPPTQEEESGLELLEQADYPEDEEFDHNLQVDEILEGLNWYANFQIALMKKAKRADAVSQVFIEKLTSEMKQSEIVVYQEFGRHEEEEEEFSLDKFGDLKIGALSQLLGTFMPIAKLEKENSYLIGTEVKQMTIRGENCMVRVGGGYVTIQEYYNRYSSKQCVSLYQNMTSQGTTFVDTVLHFLNKNNASPKVIAAYEREENWDNANTLFILLSTFAEERIKEQNKKVAKKKKTKKRPTEAAFDEV